MRTIDKIVLGGILEFGNLVVLGGPTCILIPLQEAFPNYFKIVKCDFFDNSKNDTSVALDSEQRYLSVTGRSKTSSLSEIITTELSSNILSLTIQQFKDEIYSN